MAALEIYLLNVGQADTSIIKTPEGNVIVIDAVKPKKVRNVLDEINPGGVVTHLVVTHPHNDHYSGVSSLLNHYDVRRVTLPPFWHEPGSSGYHQIINKLIELDIPTRFLAGYERVYPDGGTFPNFEGQLEMEFLGPSNSTLEELAENNVLTPNHLSIITRLRYGKFCTVFAGDAQMENWDRFDQEGMLEEKCDVLRSSHHGSRRGTQWERVEKLSPSLVVVSSDPESGHHLPDLIGSVIFLEYDKSAGQTVALTRDTGSIKITVDDPDSNKREIVAYGETAKEDIFPRPEIALPPTDWRAIVKHRIEHPH